MQKIYFATLPYSNNLPIFAMSITCFVSPNIFQNASGESVSLLHGTGNRPLSKEAHSFIKMGPKPQDITPFIGTKFGRLTVLSHAGFKKYGKSNYIMVSCKCDCGNIKTVCLSELKKKKGGTKSCGCLVKESDSIFKAKHGMYRTIEYRSWNGMLTRCHPTKGKPRYAGRGIKVCDRWKNSFENFFADMGYKPTRKHTIERINNDGNYEPSNCKWATRSEQNSNKTPSRGKYITYNGITLSITKWAEKFNINKGTLYTRLTELKYPIERALTQKIRSRPSKV